MQYSAEQIAAFVGAAAWLPQVFSWIKKSISKPKIIIIPDRIVEIGYSHLGPIFNLRLAVSTNTNDVLLDNFQAKITHESGDSKTLDWRTTKETLNQVRNEVGVSHTVEKEESGIAVKVRQDTLVDKTFRFQSHGFAAEIQPFVDSLVQHIVYLKTKDEFKREEFINSDKSHAWSSTIKSKFSWSPGKYTVQFTCKGINNSISQVVTPFSFILSSQDIQQLQENLNKIEPTLEWNMLTSPHRTLDKEPLFNWIYPKLSRL
jgi:hypothetical protein